MHSQTSAAVDWRGRPLGMRGVPPFWGPNALKYRAGFDSNIQIRIIVKNISMTTHESNVCKIRFENALLVFRGVTDFRQTYFVKS